MLIELEDQGFDGLPSGLLNLVLKNYLWREGNHSRIPQTVDIYINETLLFLGDTINYKNIKETAMNSVVAPINRVIGDISYFSKFGGSPDDLDEVTRIQIHLRYVEGVLRQESCGNLNSLQIVNRHKVLDILKEYRINGAFPKHDGKDLFETDRRPRFIDKNNTFCAVGYLIKETEGEQLAKDINRRYEYSYVEEMDYPPLLDWAHKYGLSVKDCARIQPSYYNLENCPFLNATKGTTLESKLPLLRNYRDNTLNQSISGRAVVKFYYLTGPLTGLLAKKSSIFRSLVLAFLKPTIRKLENRER